MRFKYSGNTTGTAIRSLSTVYQPVTTRSKYSTNNGLALLTTLLSLVYPPVRSQHTYKTSKFKKVWAVSFLAKCQSHSISQVLKRPTRKRTREQIILGTTRGGINTMGNKDSTHVEEKFYLQLSIVMITHLTITRMEQHFLKTFHISKVWFTLLATRQFLSEDTMLTSRDPNTSISPLALTKLYQSSLVVTSNITHFRLNSAHLILWYRTTNMFNQIEKYQTSIYIMRPSIVLQRENIYCNSDMSPIVNCFYNNNLKINPHDEMPIFFVISRNSTSLWIQQRFEI